MSTFLSTIFNPPPLNTDNNIRESRYVLAYRMSAFFALTLLLLTVLLFLYFGQLMGWVSFLAVTLLIYAIYYIRVTRKYYKPMVAVNVFALVACIVTLYGNTEQPHIPDPLWMIINIQFAFLILGNKWGLFTVLAHGIAATLFYSLFMNDQIVLIKEMTPEQIWSTGINLLICFSIIGYLSWQNVTVNYVANMRLQDTQRVLQDQYNIISKQNEEKTVMLKEIHHRVKNNLQIITSLLRLQARELESPEAIAKFKDATHRVIAMSMIHEKMYQSDQLSTMHLQEYLKDLSQDLVSSYQSGYPITINIDCTVESVGLKSIVPLALILNELISNSLKYAFDNYENCKIDISFHHHELNSKQCHLIYRDNGTWKESSRQGSFGLDLIDSLTHQLEGSMKMTTFPETSFEFTFVPLED